MVRRVHEHSTTHEHVNIHELWHVVTSLLKRFLFCRGREVWIIFILWILAWHRPPLLAISSLFLCLMAGGQWTHCIKLGKKILLTGKTDGWSLTSVTTSGNFSFPLLLFPVTSRNKVLTLFYVFLSHTIILSLSPSRACACLCVWALVRVCLSHRQGNSAVIYMRTYFCLLIMSHEEMDARHKSYKTCGVFVLYLLYPSPFLPLAVVVALAGVERSAVIWMSSSEAEVVDVPKQTLKEITSS